MMQWRIDIPRDTPLLTANQRLHWAARARRTKNLRETTAWLARAQHIPPLGQVYLLGEYVAPHKVSRNQPDKRKFDPNNWQDTAKACCDGIVDAGVVEDDDHEHVTGPDMRLTFADRPGDGQRGGQFRLYVYELSEQLVATIRESLSRPA
jgi:crossover junction endodeoxyribonuclease RusA